MLNQKFRANVLEVVDSEINKVIQKRIDHLAHSKKEFAGLKEKFYNFEKTNGKIISQLKNIAEYNNKDEIWKEKFFSLFYEKLETKADKTDLNNINKDIKNLNSFMWRVVGFSIAFTIII